MPNTVLGKVSLTPRGAYSAEVAYTALDLVGYNGGGYIALQSVQGVAPSDDGVNWMLLAGQGGTGPQGIQGPPGAVYTPTVSPEGVISWTNNGDLTNPDPVDITGPEGPTGATGASVASIERTSGTGAPGTTDTYTVKLTDGSTAGTFQVYNGTDGTGAGDFKADGTVPMTGNLQMSGNRVTGLGSAQDATDAVNKSDLEAAISSVTVTTDATPTQGSANPVQSGGVYSALLNKAEIITPQVYNLPILDNWSGNIRYSKNQFNEVICQITLTPGSDAAPGTVLGTLPEGFRPVAFIAIPAMALVSGNRSVGQLSVGPTGEIGYYGETVTAGGSSRIYASFSFVAGA